MCVAFVLMLFQNNVLDSISEINDTNMLLIILPPIVYSSAIELDLTALWRQFGSILLFAVLGTIMSALAIGTCLWFAQHSILGSQKFE
mmetsp:Transcript_16701/g.36669  ORF Transcript_16701/g.36669 Transcript_16701/m.36669 type:complete len:88 (-) Transcript_16701:330-593(-)